MTEATNTTSQQQATNTAQQTSDQAVTAQDGQKQKEETPLTFDAWYEKLDDKQKDLVDDRLSSLQGALSSEREERKKLAKQLSQLSKSAEAGSEFQKELQETVGRLEEAEKRARFLEDAHGQNVSNLKLAWMAAKEEKLLNRDGSVDFLKLREVAPELFKAKTPTPTGNAGTGNGQAGMTKPDMNKWIRGAAGKPV